MQVKISVKNIENKTRNNKKTKFKDEGNGCK